MASINQDLSITSLHLSTRSVNALKNYGVHQIKDLLALPKLDLLKVPNLGSASIAEVSDLIQDLKKTLIKENGEDYFFLDPQGYLHNDFTLTDLDLSNRCLRGLHSIHVYSLKDLVEASLMDLRAIPHFGKTSLKEIDRLLKAFKTLPFSQKGPLTAESFSSHLILDINQNLKKSPQVLYQDLLTLTGNFLDDNPGPWTYDQFLKEPSLLQRIYSLDSFQVSIQNHILSHLRHNRSGLSFKDLEGLCPPLPSFKTFFQDLVDTLVKEEKILLSQGLYYPTFPSILACLDLFFPERECQLYKLRIQGATLEEIGKELDLSRERVRQIIKEMNDFLNRENIICQEDSFRHFIQNYSLSAQEFEKIFSNPLAYGYLQTRFNYSKSQKLPLSDLLTDPKLPDYALVNLKTLLNSSYIQLEGDMVKKSKFIIHRYLLTRYALDQINFLDYFTIYKKFMVQHKLDGHPSLFVLPHNLISKLSASKEILWSFRKNFRYYPFYSYDFSKLLRELALNQYKDVEYSTKYFFTHHPQLMKEYDIRDEYELHNLLRKICLPEDYPQMKFLRMPNIRFGQGHRTDQMLQLLSDHSPISSHDLARLYEKKYGVNQKSVVATYMKCLEPYYYNGIYNKEKELLPPDILTDFKKQVTEDFYFIQDLQDKFQKAYPQLGPNYINSRSLRQLGYKVYQNYCISKNYRYARDFFRAILSKETKYKEDFFSKKFWSLANVVSNFYWLKKNLSLFHYDQTTIVNLTYLKNLGVSKEDIVHFLKTLDSLVLENRPFSIACLKSRLKDDPLLQKQLPDSFFAYLLEDHLEGIYLDHFYSQGLIYRSKRRLSLEEFKNCRPLWP